MIFPSAWIWPVVFITHEIFYLSVPIISPFASKRDFMFGGRKYGRTYKICTGSLAYFPAFLRVFFLSSASHCLGDQRKIEKYL